MSDIAQIILPVFLVIGAGYGAIKLGWFQDQFIDGMMRFAQGFAIPCLLFSAIASLDLATAFQPALLISYYAGSTTCFILGIIGARTLFNRRPGEAVAIGFCALFANSVLIGLPISEQAFGANALEPNYAIIAIHAPYCYLVGITTMEFIRADGRSFGATLGVVTKAIFSNAITIGLLLGFVVNLSGLPLPGFFSNAVDLIARSALPVALFALGATLTRYNLGADLKEVALVCVLSLLIHPLITLTLGTQVFALSQDYLRGAVVTAAMAPGINAFIFANMYDRAKGTAAASVLIATVASIGTAAVWLIILGV